MLGRAEIARLLELQALAYELLKWLDQEAVGDPELLSSAAPLLARPGTTADWLESRRDRIPAELVPADSRDAFASLFCSFFTTSFQVTSTEFGDRVVWSRVERTVPGRAGVANSQALALKHLAASEGRRITEKESSDLVKSTPGLRADLLLWTYVWELDRRARGKGKGQVAHRIWRSIPWETKRDLRADDVWAARGRLLEAVRAYLAGATS